MNSWDELNGYIKAQFNGFKETLSLIGGSVFGILGIIAAIYIGITIIKAFNGKRQGDSIDLKETLLNILIAVVVCIIGISISVQLLA